MSDAEPVFKPESSLRTVVDRLYTEFFGVFIPGAVEVGMMTLIVVMAFAAFVVSAILCFELLGNPLPYEKIIEYASRILFRSGGGGFFASSGLKIAVFVVFFSLAYLVGEVVYRMDPNKPDLQSILSRTLREYRLDNDINNRGKNPVVRDAADLREMIKKIGGNGQPLDANDLRKIIECLERLGWPYSPEFPPRIIDRINTNKFLFPYPCLRRYFLMRHLTGMACLVPWCGGFKAKRPENENNETKKTLNETLNDRRTKAYCTKHQINALKQAVLSCKKGGGYREDINKMECHIKTLAAFWSVLRTCICSVGLVEDSLLLLFLGLMCWVAFAYKTNLIMIVLGGLGLFEFAVLFQLQLLRLNSDFICKRPMLWERLSFFIGFMNKCRLVFYMIVLLLTVLLVGNVAKSGEGGHSTIECGFQSRYNCMVEQRDFFERAISVSTKYASLPSQTLPHQQSSKSTDGNKDIIRLCSLILLCFVVLFYVSRQTLIVWRRRVVDIVHDLRKRELVNVFGAARIVVDEFIREEHPPLPSVLRRFHEEGVKYEEEFCKHCQHWDECGEERCDLKWPSETSVQDGSSTGQ